MGGYGSGRPKNWGGRDTAENSLPLDIRDLHRKGLLVPGGYVRSRWYRPGNEANASSVGGRVGGAEWAATAGRLVPRRLVLSYVYRGEPVEQTLPIEWTPCPFGGARPWFRCPCAKSGIPCLRRCAVVYGAGKVFACRRCYELRYTTQEEDPSWRLVSKAIKIRERLGQAEGGVAAPFPRKPKGMWWRTYYRLYAASVAAEAAHWDALGRRLDQREVLLRGSPRARNSVP